MGNQPSSNGGAGDGHGGQGASHHHPNGAMRNPDPMRPGQNHHTRNYNDTGRNESSYGYPQIMEHQKQRNNKGTGGRKMVGEQASYPPASSDESMDDITTTNPNTHNNNANNQQFNQQTFDMASLTLADDDTVPTVFRWEHGGRQVYITGTFNDWSRQIPMHRSGNDFTYIHNLKRGKHAFKFIVDDEWRFAPDQPTVADIEGRINNFIDVTDFKAYTGDKDFEREKAAAEYGSYYSQSTTAGGNAGAPGEAVTGAGSGNALIGENAAGGEVGKDEKDGAATNMTMNPDPDGEVFTRVIPDFDEYTKEPPPLPPHLRHIILNKPPQLKDTAALPVPQHVALNHLYCTAIRDNMMVLGITQRFRTKFVTTVYYSPCAS